MSWKTRIDTTPAPWGAVTRCPLPATAGRRPTPADHGALARWQSLRAAAAFAEARRMKRLRRPTGEIQVVRSHGERLARVARRHRAQAAGVAA